MRRSSFQSIDISISRDVQTEYDNIRLVANNIANVITVAGIDVAITSVAADRATLNSLYADKAALDSIFADKAALDSLFADKATLDSLYADKATLDRLFTSIVSIDTVADSIADVDLVATDLAKGIGTNQPTDSSVLNALNNADVASTKAGEASVSAGAASTSESNAATSENNALVYLNDFKSRYFGGLVSDPALDLNGDALTDGDLYFNTVSGAFRAYNGTDWVELSTYTKAEINTANVFRADKFLAVQNVANMIYTGNDLTKVQYITATDVDYEVFTYTSGNLTGITHYVGGVLKGTTILSYNSGNLISAIFTGV